jgi:ADP-heptose:LPS heptosyltransferase
VLHCSPAPTSIDSVRKIAIFRALKLGDLLVAIPALRALRMALPRAEIILIGLPWASEFQDRFRHLVDGFRAFPGWPGLPEREVQVEEIPSFLAQMQREQFDLVVQLHGSGSIVNELCALFAGRRLAAFYEPSDHCPNPTDFLRWPESGLELRRLLALTEFLGLETRGESLEFPLRPVDVEKAGRLCPMNNGSYACIHPGASTSTRQWPAVRFAAVADNLAALGLQIVLTGTTGEAALTRAVAAAMTAPALDLAGKTDLGSVAALIASARLLVCNDTGVSHLAAALGAPSVVISTGDNPARWAPLDMKRHRVLCRHGELVPTQEVVSVALEIVRRRTPAIRSFLTEGIPCAQFAS